VTIEALANNNDIGELCKSANESAALVRTVFLTFLLTSVYIAVIIGSTTDLQLLKISPVNMPILNIELPILGFYCFIPWVYLVFHFNLLLQLYFLSRKLHVLDAAITDIPNRSQQDAVRIKLYPLAFSHMLIGHHHGAMVRTFLVLITWVTIILIPLLLLVWTQLRFIPFHNEAITWGQRIATTIDITMLWLFWSIIIEPTGNATNWWRKILHHIIYRIRQYWKLICWPFRTLIRIVRTKSIKHSGTALGNANLNRPDRAGGLFILSTTTLITLLMVYLVAMIPDEILDQKIQGFLFKDSKEFHQKYMQSPSYKNFPSFKLRYFYNRKLWFKDVWSDCVRIQKTEQTSLRNQIKDTRSEFAHLKLSCKLSYIRKLFYRPGLMLKEQILVAGTPSPETIIGLSSTDKSIRQKALDKVLGIDLSGRDLRLANLNKAILSNADLRGANLEGATLLGANLERANISDTNFSKADLQNTIFKKAVLKNVNFKNARLKEIEFKNMNLIDLDFEGAFLSDISFSGSTLKKPIFKRAIFNYVDLKGKSLEDKRSLERVDFQGSETIGSVTFRYMKISEKNPKLKQTLIYPLDLKHVKLDKANFNNSRLKSSRFEEADLEEANLNGADLTSSNLDKAKFLDATLIGATFDNASCRKTTFFATLKYLNPIKMQDTSFKNANCTGATFNGVDLRFANFEKAKLVGNKFMFERLNDVNFSGADLRWADFRYAEINTTNLSGTNLLGADFRSVKLKAIFNDKTNLNLANLSGIELKPFNEQDYTRIENALIKSTQKVGMRDETKKTFLKTLKSSIGKPSNFEKIIKNEKVMCNQEEMPFNCLSKVQIVLYAPILVEQFCNMRLGSDLSYGFYYERFLEPFNALFFEKKNSFFGKALSVGVEKYFETLTDYDYVLGLAAAKQLLRPGKEAGDTCSYFKSKFNSDHIPDDTLEIIKKIAELPSR